MNYKLIKESRKALGLTREEVAAAIGMTKGSYRNFESGYKTNANISTTKLVKLVKLLNISFGEVLNVKSKE